MTRVYLPTLPELIDRLCIVRLKSVFIPENKIEYEKEISLIQTDIDTILLEGNCRERMGAKAIHAMLVIMLSNRIIWEAESKARAGEDGDDKHLKFTHSINGLRNRAKNVLADITRERKDMKTDCLAANLPKEFGNWEIDL